MDGLETVRRIRAREQNTGSHLPVIALTADVTAESRRRHLEGGMDDFLSKPIVAEKLRSLVERWLRGRGLAEPSRAATESADDCRADEVENEILDRKSLRLIRDLQRPGRPDLVKKVVEIYLRDTPTLLESLEAAIEADDPDTVFRVAHSLKSSSAHVGARSLAAVARDIEMLGRERSLAEARQLLATVGSSYAEVKRELEANVLSA
jgi:HPt (histidine-containing phosphotransfer) domain-containing protein